MILSFTGDVSFGDVDRFTRTPFKNIGDKLSQLNCVINLEAPFAPIGFKQYPIKQKNGMFSFDDSVRYLKQINPFLVNLANNHINDFGNSIAAHTKQVLHRNRYHYFGAGFPKEDHNRFVLEKEKIVILSYVTQSVDLSYGKLFEQEGFIGPKEYSLSLFKKQIARFGDYRKVVLFHWGTEDIHYPLPEQVEIGRSLVDAGADLIVGNHPHVIQSYEQYRGKWIFYCLGHLYFPTYEAKYLNKNGEERTYWDLHDKDRNTTIVPVMEINKREIKLREILSLRTKQNFEPYFIKSTPKYNIFLFKNIRYYRTFYSLRTRVVYIYNLTPRLVRKIKELFKKHG